MKKFLYGLVSFVAIIVIIGFFLPSNYDVHRTITINAPSGVVWSKVSNLEEWPNWQTWKVEDPTIEVQIAKNSGVGAHQTWTGESGNGEVTFTEIDEGRSVRYDMVLDETYRSKGELVLGLEGNQTVVTWRMYGNTDNFSGRYFAAMMDMMVGPMFEDGLARLKSSSE